MLKPLVEATNQVCFLLPLALTLLQQWLFFSSEVTGLLILLHVFRKSAHYKRNASPDRLKQAFIFSLYFSCVTDAEELYSFPLYPHRKRALTLKRMMNCCCKEVPGSTVRLVCPKLAETFWIPKVPLVSISQMTCNTKGESLSKDYLVDQLCLIYIFCL